MRQPHVCRYSGWCRTGEPIQDKTRHIPTMTAYIPLQFDLFYPSNFALWPHQILRQELGRVSGQIISRARKQIDLTNSMEQNPCWQAKSSSSSQETPSLSLYPNARQWKSPEFSCGMFWQRKGTVSIQSLQGPNMAHSHENVWSGVVLKIKISHKRKDLRSSNTSLHK